MNYKSIIRFLYKKYSRCSDGRLRMVNYIRATCVDENGIRFPNAWGYYVCDRCGFRIKKFINGEIEDVSEREQLRYY